jgi:hypothetical protein
MSVLGAGILVASLGSSACAEQGSARQPDPNAPVAISVQGTTVALANQTDGPLADVTLTVVPYGGTGFSKSFARLDTGERRQVPLSELAAADGTRFNPVLSNPKLVRVDARTASGEEYEIELPWR